jgi:hypothetical protein
MQASSFAQLKTSNYTLRFRNKYFPIILSDIAQRPTPLRHAGFRSDLGD